SATRGCAMRRRWMTVIGSLLASVCWTGAAQADWSSPVPLAPVTSDFPTVASNAAGDALAEWWQPADAGVWVPTRHGATGAFGTPERLGASPHPGAASVALDARGDALVAWFGPRGIDIALRPAGEASWHAVERPVQPWTDGLFPAFDSRGDAALA